jgi:hypothetical protein
MIHPAVAQAASLQRKEALVPETRRVESAQWPPRSAMLHALICSARLPKAPVKATNLGLKAALTQCRARPPTLSITVGVCTYRLVPLGPFLGAGLGLFVAMPNCVETKSERKADVWEAVSGVYACLPRNKRAVGTQCKSFVSKWWTRRQRRVPIAKFGPHLHKATDHAHGRAVAVCLTFAALS